MRKPTGDLQGFDLYIRAAKARIAAKELRAWGLKNTECEKLATKLETALARYEKVRKARTNGTNGSR